LNDLPLNFMTTTFSRSQEASELLIGDEIIPFNPDRMPR